MSSSANPWNVRPLEGWVVGLSIGVPEPEQMVGYTADNVNRATVLMSESLLSAGARLVFAHDWRQDGIMNAIFKSAVRFQRPMPVSGTPKPIIQSLLPWPDQPSIDDDFRRDLEQRGILKISFAGKPDCETKSMSDTMTRAVSLSYMRSLLAKRTDARVCIGGKKESYYGFFSGVVEEAYYQAQLEKPIYPSGFLGGASLRLIEAMKERNVDAEIFRRKSAFHEKDLSGLTLKQPIPHSLATPFFETNLQSLSGLNRPEWDSLLGAVDLSAFSTLVIAGLSRLPKPEKKS